MFSNFKNIFSTNKQQSKVMTETQAEPITATKDTVTIKQESITQADETREVVDSNLQQPSAEIPTYEELTSFNPRDVIGSNEVLLHSPEIVGWFSTQEQELLFSAMLLFYSPEQSILDVGCGRADLYGYCQNLFGQAAKTMPYKGIDYNPNMLSIAQEKYPGVYTEAVDILNTPSEEKHDWVVGSGLFNLLDNSDMETYTKTVVQKMYDKANLGVVFNLMTSFPEDMADEDKAQLIQHDPVAWFEYLTQIYGKVICRTDYLEGDATFYILK